jgi:MYXO-CTERM domain-containing protein
MFRSHIVSLTAATLLVQGCNQSGQLDEVEQFIADTESLDLRQPEMVAEAAWHSDPMSVVFLSTLPALTQFSFFEGDEAPACPRLFDASDRETGIVDWRIEGDCEWQDDMNQYRIEGSIVARGDKNGIEMEYRGYRRIIVNTDTCAGQESELAVNGVVRLPVALVPPGNEEPEEFPEEEPGDTPEDEESGAGHYDIHLLFESSGPDEESCELGKIALAYDVTIDRTVGDRTVGDVGGSIDVSDVQGRMAVVLESRKSSTESWQTDWEGAWGVSAEGYGTASGDAECWDYMTGTLSLEAGGDVALLQPSAPASCYSDEQTECTAWSLNGEAQPELCGFAGLSKGFGCSAGPDAPPPWTAMFILLAGLIWQERRRRRA